jgi:hypothetical protein
MKRVHTILKSFLGALRVSPRVFAPNAILIQVKGLLEGGVPFRARRRPGARGTFHQLTVLNIGPASGSGCEYTNNGHGEDVTDKATVMADFAADSTLKSFFEQSNRPIGIAALAMTIISDRDALIVRGNVGY